MEDWLIYGANGYTGALIAREAAARGLRPVLAGRNRTAVETLAAELDLEFRVFEMGGQPLAASCLEGVRLVLNCAGPFSATAEPMMRACLQTGAHYLDITGEIAVFEFSQTLSEAARAARVVICPGVGFDVIPTDCIALALSQALPSASHLALGFETSAAMSPGTAKTSVEGMASGGKVRRDGKITTVAMGLRTRRIDFGNGERIAMALPWGDVSTAFYTTGIPNIEVFLAVGPGLLWAARLGNLLGPLMGWAPVQSALKKRAAAIIGPSAASRSRSACQVWGEVRGPGGETRTARIRTANGYDVTVHGALAVVDHLLKREGGEVGTMTPARLCGADLVTRLPGSGPLTIT